MEFAPFPPVDRISNLPVHIVDQILMCLTTRDAARTCILSKQWRYKWVQLPHLIFDDEMWHEFKKNEKSISDQMSTMKFLLFIYQVFLRHQGPITKFSLIIDELEGCSEIDHLINFLLKYDIEEFTLEIDPGYILPSSLFMYLKLKSLSIFGCSINPPSTFKGFKKLVRLELTHIDIEANVLQSLISSCPILEQLLLYLDNSIEFEPLEIDAPMLRLLQLECFCSSIYIKRSPHLATVTVCACADAFTDGVNAGDVDVDFNKYGKCNFFEFFDSLPALQQLRMDCYILLILSAGQVQTRLPVSLIHLKILDLSKIYLDFVNELSWVLCLIRSSPNLEKMNIEQSSRKLEKMNIVEATDASQVLDFLKVQDYSDVLLNQLEEVEIDTITGAVSEMKLIKLLLEKSPKLKRMLIWQHRGKCGPSTEKVNMILKELNEFVRASPNAMVIYKN